MADSWHEMLNSVRSMQNGGTVFFGTGVRLWVWLTFDGFIPTSIFKLTLGMLHGQINCCITGKRCLYHYYSEHRCLNAKLSPNVFGCYV